MDKSVEEIYGNRARVRVCGICIEEDKVLLVNHAGLAKGDFWAPPGGGIEPGISAQNNLKREFKEETGLDVEVGAFLFATEYIQAPLHAVELFFAVTRKGGLLGVGSDPEMESGGQIIKDVRFMTFRDVDALGRNEKHGAFQLCSASGKIKELNGYHTISPVSPKTT